MNKFFKQFKEKKNTHTHTHRISKKFKINIGSPETESSFLTSSCYQILQVPCTIEDGTISFTNTIQMVQYGGISFGAMLCQETLSIGFIFHWLWSLINGMTKTAYGLALPPSYPTAKLSCCTQAPPMTLCRYRILLIRPTHLTRFSSTG